MIIVPRDTPNAPGVNIYPELDRANTPDPETDPFIAVFRYNAGNSFALCNFKNVLLGRSDLNIINQAIEAARSYPTKIEEQKTHENTRIHL